MKNEKSLFEDLQQARDELRVQIHLGSMEAQDEWQKLEKKWEEFASKAELRETGESLGDALRAVGDELLVGYEKLKTAVQSK